jgi:hypothetical protein
VILTRWCQLAGLKRKPSYLCNNWTLVDGLCIGHREEGRNANLFDVSPARTAWYGWCHECRFALTPKVLSR